MPWFPQIFYRPKEGYPDMKRTAKFIASQFAVVAIIFTLVSLVSQAQSVTPEMQHASDLLLSKHWAEAASAYDTILKAEPANPRAYYQLGLARYQLQQYPAAAAAFEGNIKLNPNPFAMFNAACSYAKIGKKDQAFAWLAKVFVPENQQAPLFNINDPDLSALHDDARWAPMALTADKLKNPCMHSAEARQFDFWVGEWDVFDPTGRKAGDSAIQRVAGGCGVLENWTSNGGGDGKSINFYDPQTHQWYQYWIGSDGQPTRFNGVYREGALRYDGEPSMVNGHRQLSRLTFFNVDANTVRQLSEHSDDEGKTWIVNYDFKYVRKTATAESQIRER
jgi:tetratricopeptide (TPR) repeat protein